MISDLRSRLRICQAATKQSFDFLREPSHKLLMTLYQ